MLAVIFIAINYALTAVARLVERRLQRSAKGGPPVDPEDPNLGQPGANLTVGATVP